MSFETIIEGCIIIGLAMNGAIRMENVMEMTPQEFDYVKKRSRTIALGLGLIKDKNDVE